MRASGKVRFKLDAEGGGYIFKESKLGKEVPGQELILGIGRRRG